MPNNYIRFWGVRGSYPTPFASHLKYGGNTTCLEIRSGDKLVIIDGGTGIIRLGELLMQQSEIREILLVFTHYHWDHIYGLPFFIPAYVPDFKIRIFGPGKSPQEVEEKLSEQMRDPYFPVEIGTSWLADIQYLDTKLDSLEHGDIKLRRFNVHHPGTTFGYRIELNGKTTVFVPDQELLFINHPIDQRLGEGDVDEAEKQLLRAMKEEEKLRSLKHMMDADYLIHDSQYTQGDYERKRGWGHSCYVDTVNCAVDARAKKLFLFHHDPSYNDEAMDALHQAALDIIKERDANLECALSEENLLIDLD